MIYISAQPDEVYFLWQLELQLFNFHAMGIGDESIHILVGYKPEKGIHPQFLKFACTHPNVQMYFYPDKREKKRYPSSIRPHLLAQHFRAHRKLEAETVFYHDSDMLFTSAPNWDELCTDEVWYASDTRAYLDSHYFRRFVDDKEFAKICGLLSLSPQDVMQHDANAGGAQYILKKCPATFWEKAEYDCERLFTYLDNKQKYGTCIQKGLQTWCTDMWVIWWNAILQNRAFRIHPALDFCWADSPSHELQEKKILHYTGRKSKNSGIFEKTLFQTHSPFYADLSGIRQDTSSQWVAETIQAYRQELDAKRLKATSIRLIVITPDDEGSWRKAQVARRYYEKYWDMDIAICRPDETKSCLQQGSNNLLLPCNRIIPMADMKKILDDIAPKRNTSFKFPMKVWQMDSLGRHIFSQILNNDYLEENKGKTISLLSMEELTIIHGQEFPVIFSIGPTINAYGL